MKARYGLTMVFIAHDLAVVKNISDNVAVMYLGKFCEIGGPDELFAHPAHPYTQALIASIPVPDPEAPTEHDHRLEGDLPSPLNPPSGCRFRTRCPRAQEHCAEHEPQIRMVGDGHYVACHFPLEQPVEITTRRGTAAAQAPRRPRAELARPVRSSVRRCCRRHASSTRRPATGHPEGSPEQLELGLLRHLVEAPRTCVPGADPVIPGRPHVEASQREHQEHVGRPTADPPHRGSASRPRARRRAVRCGRGRLDPLATCDDRSSIERVFEPESPHSRNAVGADGEHPLRRDHSTAAACTRPQMVAAAFPLSCW